MAIEIEGSDLLVHVTENTADFTLTVNGEVFKRVIVKEDGKLVEVHADEMPEDKDIPEGLIEMINLLDI